MTVTIHMFDEDFTLDLNKRVDLLGYAMYCAWKARCDAYDKMMNTVKHFENSSLPSEFLSDFPLYQQAEREYLEAYRIEEQASDAFMTCPAN